MVLAVEVDSRFFIPLVILAVVLGNLSLRVKCPYCGDRIMVRKVGLAKMPLAYRFWPPKDCPNCSRQL